VSSLVALSVNRPAIAQVHADASVEVGVMKRFLTGSVPGTGDASFGPTAEIAAHVALVPLVRVGAYIGHDISPRTGSAAARDVTWGGARVKVMSPWIRSPFRAWVFAGFGIAGVYARSYATTVNVPAGPNGAPAARPGVVQGSSGGFFEVPFGIGASYKLREPWELCAELGARVGFAHRGRVYEAPGPDLLLSGAANGNAAPAGSDVFALALTIGVIFDL